jgi:hypothetical protein
MVDETKKSHIEKLFKETNDAMESINKSGLPGKVCKDRVTVCAGMETDPCSGTTSHICKIDFSGKCSNLVAMDNSAKPYPKPGCPHCPLPINPGMCK